jgi:hypothetical protein
MNSSTTLQMRDGLRFLSRGPSEVTSTQEMEMEVKNSLASVYAGIDDYAKPVLRNALFLRELGGDDENMPNYCSIALVQIQQCRNMLARDNQNMNRRFRIDVLKSHHGVIFVDHITLDPFLDNATE